MTELLDALSDLQHDLGKYLHLPLALLPREAGADEVRRALATALLETRRGPGGARSARQLWESFVADGGARLQGRPAYAALSAAVERALAWERFLDPGAPPIEREALEQDLQSVGIAIRALLVEVQADG